MQILLSHNNQNTKSTKQRKNTNRSKRKRPDKIQRQTCMNYTQHHNRDIISQKDPGRFFARSKNPQMLTYNTIPRKTQSPQMEKTRYLKTCPKSNNIYPHIQIYRKYEWDNSYPMRITTSKKYRKYIIPYQQKRGKYT